MSKEIPTTRRDRVEDIITRETSHLHGLNAPGRNAASIAISRAAYAASKLGGQTIPEILDYQHARIDELQSKWKEGKTVLIEPVSAEDRERFGYGDQPDSLIRDVESQVSQVVPDYVPSTLARQLAAQTLHVVRAEPGIDALTLRRKLGGEGLPTQGREFNLASVVALDGAVTIAHFLAANYYGSPQAAYTEKI